MSWYSKDFCAYKENIYGQNEFFSNSKNEIDKIFSSILSDYKVFDDCNVWLLNNNFKSELIEYENFIKNPYDIINKISLNFLDKKTKFNLEYFTFNNKKLDSSKLDRIFISNIRKSIRNLKLKGYFQDGEFKLNYISIRNYLFNTFLFHYPIRMIEAINRRILKKFNSKGKI